MACLPRRLIGAWVLTAAFAANAQIAAFAAGVPEPVILPSFDAPDGKPVMLTGLWFGAGTGRRPAVVMLHGCGGAFDRRGAPSERMREYAAMSNHAGWHALLVDSLGPRGVAELCTQPPGGRKVTQQHRRLDALAALSWLASRDDVDRRRLALLGWSNGGSTVLAASNLAQADVARAQPVPAALVAFYPGCEAELKRGYRPSAPLLMLVGDSDDWTPAAPCRELQVAASPLAQIVGYAGAHHGFDGRAALRLRRDVPGGVRPGAGVHVGADPAAREDAQRRLLAFLRERFAP